MASVAPAQQLLSFQKQFLAASFEKKSLWTLKALNELIDVDSRDGNQQIVPARVKDEQLSERLGLGQSLSRKLEVVLRRARLEHQRPEFVTYNSSGQKTGWQLYKYGSIVLEPEFLDHLRDKSGLELQHSNRWSNFEVVMHDYSTSEQLKPFQSQNRKRKASVRTDVNRKKSCKPPPQKLATTGVANSERTQQSGRRYTLRPFHRNGIYGSGATSMLSGTSFKGSRHPALAKRPESQLRQDLPDVSDVVEMTLTTDAGKRSPSAPSYSNLSFEDDDIQTSLPRDPKIIESHRSLPVATSVTQSRLQVATNEDDRASNFQQVFQQYLNHRDVMHGLENGAILNLMSSIIDECDQAATNLFDRRADLDPFRVVEFRSQEDISIIHFGHSDQREWTNIAPVLHDICQSGLQVDSAFRGCLQAFILREVFSSALATFLRPQDEFTSRLSYSLQNTADLFEFHQFIRYRACVTVLQSKWFHKKTKDEARRLAIKFCGIIEGLLLQGRVPEWYLVSANPDWKYLLQDELESIFGRCLAMRIKIALDEDKREVTFKLPGPGQDFESIRMEYNNQEARRGRKMVSIALGPEISVRSVLAHPAGARTSVGEPLIIRKATVLLCSH
ncbi:hypothetical protein MMC11_002740 [Xylographa trunciseda]|nr:hypothetical protein [Xylographa trunciseda]